MSPSLQVHKELKESEEYRDNYIPPEHSLAKEIKEFLTFVEKKERDDIINANRKRIQNKKNKRQGYFLDLLNQFNAACREKTASTKTEKGSHGTSKAQSSKEEEAPKVQSKKTREPRRIRVAKSAEKQKAGSAERLMKELREMVQDRKRKEIIVDMQIETVDTKKVRSIKALLDSGCTNTCIDRAYCEAENLEMQPLETPVRARNADGTENAKGLITHYVDLIVRIRGHQERQRFLVTLLGKTRAFLGFDWLKKHNPIVDWVKGKITFDRCPEDCGYEGLEEGESLLLVDFELEKIDNIMDICAHEATATRLAHEARKSEERREGKRSEEQTIHERVPPQYHEHIKVFEKESFDALPERRPWDHAIELKPGSEAVDCKIYPLSREEQGKLDEFLEENLKSGRIRPSKSPMASAFFFVKKKDGSL